MEPGRPNPRTELEDMEDPPIIPTITTAKELMKMKIPKDFIIEKLLRPGELAMLYSPSGSFKSFIAMHLALCVSNKKDFFGYSTKQKKVLILDNENSIPLLATRLKKMASGMEIKKRNYPLIFALKQGQLDNPRFFEGLKITLLKEKIDLLIIDTLRRVHSGEENSSRDMNELYKLFDELMKIGIAILFLHHTNKGNEEFRGSVDLKGMLDVQVKVERIGDSNKMIIKNEKNRWGEIDPINVEINPEGEETIYFTQLDEINQEKTDKYAKFKKARGFVLQQVKELCNMDGMTFKRIDIIDALDAYNADNPNNALSKRTVDSALRDLVKKKYLAKSEKAGTYIRNFSEKTQLTLWINDFRGEKSENP